MPPSFRKKIDSTKDDHCDPNQAKTQGLESRKEQVVDQFIWLPFRKFASDKLISLPSQLGNGLSCQKSIFCLAQKFATLQVLLCDGSALRNPKGPATKWSIGRREKIFLMRALGRIAEAVKFCTCSFIHSKGASCSPNAMGPCHPMPTKWYGSMMPIDACPRYGS